MYAAAGGASIAKRREQKRLALKQLGVGGGGGSATTVGNKKGSGSGLQHQNKFSRTHLAPLHSAAAAATASAESTGAFHSSHDHQKNNKHNQHRHSHSFHHLHYRKKRPDPIIPQRNHLVPPVSPIQFPISPPPLSLESQNSSSLQLKTSNFPFPPPSFLDLRVASPTASELQVGIHF